MRDSDTYMMIIDEGRLEEAKSFILRLGKKRFGAADEAITTKLSAITDLERLHRLQEYLFDAASWQELLESP
jgi:hypothetical protein